MHCGSLEQKHCETSLMCGCETFLLYARAFILQAHEIWPNIHSQEPDNSLNLRSSRVSVWYQQNGQ